MIKSNYASILNRLHEMQQAPYYATAKEALSLAEQTIVDLETKLAAACEIPAAQVLVIDDRNKTIKNLKAAIEGLLETDDTPEPNCSCHISPPCSDCVEYSGRREALEFARRVIK